MCMRCPQTVRLPLTSAESTQLTNSHEGANSALLLEAMGRPRRSDDGAGSHHKQQVMDEEHAFAETKERVEEQFVTLNEKDALYDEESLQKMQCVWVTRFKYAKLILVFFCLATICTGFRAFNP